MGFGSPPIHVLGSSPLAAQVAAGMRAGGRPVRLMTAETLDPGRARLLILADPPDAPALLKDLCERARGRRRFWGGTARWILMHQGDAPPALPPLDLADRVRIETFAIERRAARALLARWPLHAGMDPLFGQPSHLLIAGSASPAAAFLTQALRLMAYGERRPMVTLLAEDPERLAARLATDYPQAGQIADLRLAALGTSPPLAGLPPVTLALVCVADPGADGLDLARALGRAIAGTQGVSPPILLETGLCEPRGEVGDWDGQIVPVSHVRLACRPEVLLDGVGDAVARGIHDHYRDTIAAQGRDPELEPAGRPWARLDESYRQANRYQADHLWAKLAVTDCRAVAEEMVESFAFTPLEVERLAAIEHQRWAADRYLDGWIQAPTRDNRLKHHPQLIPYADLSEPMKDLDRFAVRGVPSLLARSGLGLVRRLIVGLSETDPDQFQGAAAASRMRSILERLVSRYPDRALILATSLRHPEARRFARLSLDVADAGLFWLLPGRLDALLESLPDRAARSDLLALGARAERRVCLGGEAELERWIADRAEIALVLGEPRPAGRPAKQVVLSSAGQPPEWSFEY
ncbi:RyR domain-containing protein [Thiocystis violacea]|uniref:RyR domain-containing protein n=1 Tax=Thiocystis violacea TaxID=13725 RepID=UPI00190521CA|nr:RyR domain-containing protein [Thiocystis violacea]MBK1718881.1 Ryanodine receptor Ryr [Thiocystis violacea]